MIGYTSAKIWGILPAVVTLEIPDDAETNIKRDTIVNPLTATYKTNKARVLCIETPDGVSSNRAECSRHIIAYSDDPEKHPLLYVVDEEIIAEKYGATHISFFLSTRPAELYDIYGLKHGLYERWFENGRKRMEWTTVNWKRDGVCRTWHNCADILDSECTYVDGRLEGLSRQWSEDGTLTKVRLYKNGNEISFQELCSERTKLIKEELIQVVYHPDRIEALGGMDYLDLIE